jgi:fatty-acyl-CoA synthase/long-chain acyl-CoA synthetase
MHSTFWEKCAVLQGEATYRPQACGRENMASEFTSLKGRNAVEQEMAFADRDFGASIYDRLSRTTKSYAQRPALSYQITSGPKDKAETLTWSDLHAQTTQAANMFRELGIEKNDVIAYILPNCTETAVTFLGGMVAGIVNPINPLLEPEQIASILRETNAKVVVTLRAFPKADIAQNVSEAVRLSPNVQTVLEVDLLRYLSPPKSWIVPFLRPKIPASRAHHAPVLNFRTQLNKQPKTLTFEDDIEDRVVAYLHTGGTTGLPKVAQHRASGMLYNSWLGSRLLFTEQDSIMCPLPLFHVFACHVVMMSMIGSGAHGVFPTPAGYRGEGVFDNFWKLLERWETTFVITVPTALAALMQRPIDADISKVKLAFSGSSPLPAELYKRFEETTNIELIEGYGLTEATCLVAVNPIGGSRKIGSVGFPLPHSDIKIIAQTPQGPQECPVGEIGEICIDSPGVYAGATYVEADKNADLFAKITYLRTGDLGRFDDEGYLWITGRAKDLIIRGGHNIDPAEIEEALAGHPDVALIGAIGQPDVYAGELPCAYVELIEGAQTSIDDLMNFAKTHIQERAATPKHIEIVDAMPKTAVGKVFKPDLRKQAITRVFDAALAARNISARVEQVTEDKKRGLVAHVSPRIPEEEAAVAACLDQFTTAWGWHD